MAGVGLGGSRLFFILSPWEISTTKTKEESKNSLFFFHSRVGKRKTWMTHVRKSDWTCCRIKIIPHLTRCGHKIKRLKTLTSNHMEEQCTHSASNLIISFPSLSSSRWGQGLRGWQTFCSFAEQYYLCMCNLKQLKRKMHITQSLQRQVWARIRRLATLPLIPGLTALPTGRQQQHTHLEER